MNIANQPAFPRQGAIHNKGEYGGHEGMTLRQYYAGLMMQGLLQSAAYGAELARVFDENGNIAASGEQKESPQAYTSRIVLSLADALIAELEKP